MTSNIANLFKSADLDAVTNIIIRKNIHNLNSQNLTVIKESIM